MPKIQRAMQGNGSPPPESESDHDRTYFLIRLPVHERAERDAPQVPPQVTPQVTGLSFMKTPGRQRHVTVL